MPHKWTTAVSFARVLPCSSRVPRSVPFSGPLFQTSAFSIVRDHPARRFVAVIMGSSVETNTLQPKNRQNSPLSPGGHMQTMKSMALLHELQVCHVPLPT